MIRLVRANAGLLDAAIAGDGPLAIALGHEVVPGWATFRDALQSVRDSLGEGAGDTPWGARLFVAGEPPELVGWGGFKGPPVNGIVELGYEIAQARRRRGLATAAVEAMVAEALACDRVTAVIAHTLPERNASNRVLEKAGFRFDGAESRSDGILWRYSLVREGAA